MSSSISFRKPSLLGDSPSRRGFLLAYPSADPSAGFSAGQQLERKNLCLAPGVFGTKYLVPTFCGLHVISYVLNYADVYWL